MPDDPNLPRPDAGGPPPSRGRPILILVALCLGVCLAVALIGPIGRLLGVLSSSSGLWPGEEYESTAIIEVVDNHPIGSAEEPAKQASSRPAGKEPTPAAAELPTMRVRMLSWNSIREIVLSRHVDFGHEVDPDDHRQLEEIHDSIRRRVRIEALGPRHIAVSHRSQSPSLNASLVNELVKSYTNEDRRVTQEQAKQDLKYYRDRYAVAYSRLSEVDSQLREFTQANPWLRDAVEDIHAEYKAAEEKEREVTVQIGELEQELAKRRSDLRKEKPDIEKITKVPPAPEWVEAQRQYDETAAYFEQVKTIYAPAHTRYQDARRRFNDATAYLKKMEKEKGGGEAEIRELEPNPAYVRIEAEVKAHEKAIDKLFQQKLAVNKRVNELYVLVRRAPELLAQRRKLEDDRQVAAGISEENSRYLRAAEKELQRLMTDAYSSKFRIIEYAREEHRPFDAAGGGGEEEASPWSAESSETRDGGGAWGGMTALALACAAGLLIGTVAVVIVLRRRSAQASPGGWPPPDPKPRSAAGLAIVVAVCLLAPILVVVGAVMLYPSYPSVGAPRPAEAPEPALRPLRFAAPSPPRPTEIQVPDFVGPFAIRFTQIDPASGLVTTGSHVFRELLPADSHTFVVESGDETHGKIRLYRLRNLATTAAFDFRDVPVRKRVSGCWAIEEEVGWKVIRDQLQGKMRMLLAMPAIGR